MRTETIQLTTFLKVHFNDTRLFKTIGYTDNFEPFLLFLEEEREQAFKDLTNAIANPKFTALLNTGVELTEEEHVKFAKQFEDKAKIVAEQILDRVVIHGKYFFTYLPECKK